MSPASRPFDYHTMTSLDRQLAADAAHLALDGIQQKTPEEIMLGVAVLFAALTHRCQLDANDLYLMGRRVLVSEDFHRRANDSLQSLQDFAGIRIKGEHNVSIS